MIWKKLATWLWSLPWMYPNFCGEGDMSMKPLSYIVSNICFQVFVAFFKIHECTQITMGPLMYPDFHVKNDRFLFPLDLPWLYSKFYGTAYLQDLFHYIFYFVVFYIYSSFFFPSQMFYIIYLDGFAIYFLICRTLSILSFLHCCPFQLTLIFFFPFSIHYV